MRRLSLNEPLINQVYFKNSLIIGNYVISYFTFLTYHLFIVHMSVSIFPVLLSLITFNVKNSFI